VERDSCGPFGAGFIECPTQIDGVLKACEFAPVERYQSSCGGVFVEASNGVQTQRWSFDADGELIGTLASGDVGDCEFWGTLCSPVGEAELLCGAGGQGGGGGQGGQAGQDAVGGQAGHGGDPG
jgi:hypothetical protein